MVKDVTESGGGATVSTKNAQVSSDFTTTSTSFVDVTGLTVTLNTITNGVYFATCSMNTAITADPGRIQYTKFIDDGVADNQFLSDNADSASANLYSTISKVGVASGQILKIQVKVNGSATGRWNTPTRISVIEVG
jgi:hypothetical protein